MVSSQLVVKKVSAVAVAVAACAVAFGCGSDATPTQALPAAGAGGNNVGGQGGSAGGSASSGAPGSGGSLAGAGGSAGSTAGAVGSSGSAGTAGSSAGASGSAGVSGAGCVTMGTQADPGVVGDGKSAIPEPYTAAPETLSHLNNAPLGKVNGVDVGGKYTVLTYTAKSVYPGVNSVLTYEYWIYVPAQYKQGCAAALMVWQDGLHFVGIDDAKFNAPTVLDNLIASGDMPVTIGVFINPGEPGNGHYDGQEYQNRHVQYDKNDPSYVTFLVDEFLAQNVLNKYTIVTDPDGWGIGGHSSGGIAAFMAGWYRPEKFHKLLTHDASFPNTGNYMNVSLLDAVGNGAAKPLRVYLMSGPNDLDAPNWYNGNTNAATKLQSKGYHYQYRTENSMHYPPVAGVSDFANALKWMWRGYKL